MGKDKEKVTFTIMQLASFVPSPDAKPKPVIVYIHGGMFAWGSGNLVDGTVFAAYSDVVFVSINYRLGILGFLNLNDSPSSKPRVANYGLMDQIAALHWIKENIPRFGGDPDNITLMGWEAGAACINFLMSSPTTSPGLFHRAILIAGSSHSPWALIQEPRGGTKCPGSFELFNTK
ncbi:neuroligin-4, X-linked [Folsomia candida]|uniref:neuroligin-4, X-linked n=1 Tax=Folsomia candida TaxID=158441 RepID=UPI0016053DCC|nr:neuroligin-4, X-linked [Folsomia candida]